MMMQCEKNVLLFIMAFLVFGTVAHGQEGDDCTGSPALVAVNPFPISGPIEVATDGIFAIWWDATFDHASDTSTIFDRLATVRDDALNVLGMRDPPNLEDCVYYNVYIHHGPDDEFPEWWANGQGTDENGRPYLTLPDGVHLEEPNTYHEGFHIFQYNSDAPGFESEDSYWFIETSAQWYMATKIPNDDNAFIEAGAVIANPQLALWHSFDNGAPGDSEGWYYQVRQYGMHTLLFYLTEFREIERGILVNGFYGDNPLSPQEYLYTQIGPDNLRRLFADWAAENAAGMTYLTPGQYERAMEEADAIGEPEHFNPYVADISASDLDGGWTWQPCAELSCLRPRGWSYNVIRIANDKSGDFVFELDGDPTGSEGAASHFEARIVIMEPNGPRIETMSMANARDGEHLVIVDSNVSEIFVVIASVPGHFTGNQTYGYQLRASFFDSVPPAVFQDGFESGTTSNWSVSNS